MIRVIILICIYSLLLYPNKALASSGGIPSSVTPKQKQQAPAVREEKSSPAVKPKITKPQKKIDRTAEERREKRELIKVKKAELNNIEWSIDVAPLKKPADGNMKQAVKDKAIFKGGKVSLESMMANGFSPTNYTLTIKDNGGLTWETMKTGKDGNVAFIRADITPDAKSMRGVISYPKENVSEDYSFKSTAKKVISP